MGRVTCDINNKIEKEGVDSEYVETSSYAGVASTEDDVFHIEYSIEMIRKKSS